MKLLTEKCNICGEDVKPATSAVQLARNVGLHRRAKHGIAGRHNSRYLHEKALREAGGARSSHSWKPPTNEAPIKGIDPLVQNNNEMAREVPLPGPDEKHYRRNKRTDTSVEPAYLPECPQCHARFYVAKGQV